MTALVTGPPVSISTAGRNSSGGRSLPVRLIHLRIARMAAPGLLRSGARPGHNPRRSMNSVAVARGGTARERLRAHRPRREGGGGMPAKTYDAIIIGGGHN